MGFPGNRFRLTSDHENKNIFVNLDIRDLEDFLYPCGNCRCVLAEFGDMEVFLTKSTGTEYRFHRLSEIYPGSFKTMSGLLNKQPNGN